VLHIQFQRRVRLRSIPEGSESRARMRRTLFTATLFFVAVASAQPPPTSAKHPFTFEDMMALKRVSGPVPSPDGKWVVFAAEEVDLKENTKKSHLWIVPASGGDSRRLNESPNEEERPRFSPDGTRLIFTSKATDPPQIWMCDFDADSGALKGKPHQVTNISTGADGGIWSPDGKNIVFVSAVYPDCKDDAENRKRDEELKKSKVKAKIFTRLFYRHWNAFSEFKRNHLFVVSADSSVGAGVSPAGAEPMPPGRRPLQEPRDLTPGDHDVPPFHLGGQDMYAISPDGQEVAYTSNIESEAGPAFVEATSTNSDIFVVPIAVESAVPSGQSPDALRTAHATAQPKKISTSAGADSTPLYSPDGKYVAWRSQARAGFEADKWRLLVQDRQSGKIRDLSIDFDRSVGSFCWQKGNVLWLAYEQFGQAFFGNVDPTTESGIHPYPFSPLREMHADDLAVMDRTIFYTQSSIKAPNEIWSWVLGTHASATQEPGPITHMNDALLSQIDMQPLESFTFKGANDEDVQGFLVRPPGFDSAKKHPLKFLIHGGPQGAWGNSWTYRLNAELFAANSESFREQGGYVVVMINFHGSTGYGQKFTDSISGDWGGKPYVDLMKGLDYVEKTYPFIDRTARPRSVRATAVTWRTGFWATPTASNASCRTTGRSIPSQPTARRRSCGLTNGNSKGRRGSSASSIANSRRICSPTNLKRQRWLCMARTITGSTFHKGSICSPRCSD
jgi:dipeptidyl aminopeptidase/acylaminoacyl peptidase